MYACYTDVYIRYAKKGQTMNKDIVFTKLVDKLMQGTFNRKRFELFVSDMGNATCTGISSEGTVTFPHAIRKLDRSEYDALDQNRPSPNVYEVNGVAYELGSGATRAGQFALRFGAQRYTPDYFGVLYAIALFHAYKKPPKQLYVMANHPPMHLMYRPEIISSIEGKFIVENMGVKKVIEVTEVGCYHEPTGGWIHALFNDDGSAIAAPHLVQGEYLVIDIGGHTTDFSATNRGVVNTTMANCKSIQYGMLDVLERFEDAVRRTDRRTFMQIPYSVPYLWREAFRDGLYDGKAYGKLACAEQTTNIGEEAVVKIFDAIENEMGGLGVYTGILLSGGGGSMQALGRYVESYILSKDLDLQLFYADENPADMHLATAKGARKQALAFMKKGALWSEKNAS